MGKKKDQEGWVPHEYVKDWNAGVSVFIGLLQGYEKEIRQKKLLEEDRTDMLVALATLGHLPAVKEYLTQEQVNLVKIVLYRKGVDVVVSPRVYNPEVFCPRHPAKDKKNKTKGAGRSRRYR